MEMGWLGHVGRMLFGSLAIEGYADAGLVRKREPGSLEFEGTIDLTPKL